ncbi:MAG: hypothetical protein OXD49_05250 [Candidatus Poribacteria bacterium]|nr:hypothetical protein [Candidatus Poribacteria bacterium]
MIPTEAVLSPQSYAKLVSELTEKLGSSGISHLQLAHHLALPVSIQQENTDLVVLKELTPNPCPICHRRLTFLRETMERFENDSSNLVRCPMGHRYPGVLKVYYLNIFQHGEKDEIEKPIKTCPECDGKNIQYLAPKVMFCLDCDWDSGMEARY